MPALGSRRLSCLRTSRTLWRSPRVSPPVPPLHSNKPIDRTANIFTEKFLGPCTSASGAIGGVDESENESHTRGFEPPHGTRLAIDLNVSHTGAWRRQSTCYYPWGGSINRSPSTATRLFNTRPFSRRGNRLIAWFPWRKGTLQDDPRDDYRALNEYSVRTAELVSPGELPADEIGRGWQQPFANTCTTWQVGTVGWTEVRMRIRRFPW